VFSLPVTPNQERRELLIIPWHHKSLLGCDKNTVFVTVQKLVAVCIESHVKMAGNCTIL